MDKNAKTAGGRMIRSVLSGLKPAAERAVQVFMKLKEKTMWLLKRESPVGVLTGCMCGGAAYLLSRAKLGFGSQPLGIAWICASPGHITYILAGEAASALTGAGWVGFFASVFAAGLRIVVRYAVEPHRESPNSDGGNTVTSGINPFSESLYLRMATAAAAAFGGGLYRIFSGGLYFYDLWGAVISMFAAPAAVMLFSPLFGKNKGLPPEQDSWGGRLLTETAYICLPLALTFSLRGESAAGLLLVHTLAAVFTLFTVKYRGTLRGTVCGLLCGAAAGLEYAPVYGIGALCAALIMPSSSLAAAASLTAVSGIRCLIARDAAGFISAFPAQLAGIIVFCTVLPAADRLIADEAGKKAAAGTGTAEGQSSRERMAELSDAFGKLAESFRDMSRERRKPSLAELRQICDEVCDESCPDCRERTLCWDLEYASTLDMICKICSAVHNDGHASPDVIPPYMKKRCPAAAFMLDSVNARAEALTRERLEDSRLSVFASDYKALSAVLNDALAAGRADMTPDPGRGEEVCAVLDRAGIKYGAVYVTGSRLVRILIDDADLSHSKISAGELRHRLEQVCGVCLTQPEFVPGCGRPMVELCTKRRLGVSFSAARSAADDEGEGAFCGDTVCRVENRDGYFYSVICDGMGTGSDAAYASGICSMFLKRMLGARIGAETALSMLNAVLRADAGECSVGVDILRVDLLTGRASLFKSGAAPTYIRRDGRVFPVESPSAPIGILRELEAVRSDFDLLPGDVLLMTSDGIDPEGGTVERNTVWLLDMLDGCDPADPESPSRTARKIITAARSAGSRDDASAAIITVSAAV